MGGWMTGPRIRTNHQWRDLLHWHELSDKERERFDWLDSDEARDEAQFFRYRGWTYCLDEFMRSEAVPNFHGFAADSFYSGVAIMINPDGERVIAATVIA